MAIKNRIKEARLKNNLTQEQLARLIGVAKSTVTGYEKGTSEPNIDTLARIMSVLNIDANYLWQDETDFPISVSYDEMEIIEKFRNLDSYGRKAVTYILDVEHERTQTVKEATVPPVQSSTAIKLVNYYHSASAGSGIFILGNENVDTLKLPDSPENKKVDYAITVSGDSMEPDYHDGDIVLVSQKSEMCYGDVGIFIVDGSAYIKEYGEHALISRNPFYGNIAVSEYGNIVCMGKVIGKLNDKLMD